MFLKIVSKSLSLMDDKKIIFETVYIKLERVRKFSVTSESEIEIDLDGEYICRQNIESMTILSENDMSRLRFVRKKGEN